MLASYVVPRDFVTWYRYFAINGCGGRFLLPQALRSMYMAITTKTGLAPGVALSSLRPYVEEGLTLSELAPAAGSGGAGLVEGLGEEAAAAVTAEVKAAVMQVLI